MHNERLHDIYSSPDIVCNQITEDEVCGACGTYRCEEKCMQDFRWEDNIKMDVKCDEKD